MYTPSRQVRKENAEKPLITANNPFSTNTLAFFAPLRETAYSQ